MSADNPQRQRIVLWIGNDDEKMGMVVNGHCQAWEMKVQATPPAPGDSPAQFLNDRLPCISLYLDAVEGQSKQCSMGTFIVDLEIDDKLETSRLENQSGTDLAEIVQ